MPLFYIFPKNVLTNIKNGVIITVLTQIIQMVQLIHERRTTVLNIRLEGKLPIYEQLYNGISRLAMSGELAPDEKLPAVREVAKQFGINPNTVQKAYAQLEQAGFIYSIPAKGSYVSGGNGAADAAKRDALERTERELEYAFAAGVSLDEIKLLADKIWSGGGKGGNL